VVQHPTPVISPALPVDRVGDATERSADAAVRQLEPREWDERVARRDGHPLQSWAWGDVKAAIGWQALRLASSDGRACAQLLLLRDHDFTLAYVPRGPILSGSAAADRAFVDELARAARSEGASFVRFEPDILERAPAGDDVRATLRGAGFRTSERTIQPRSSIRLDLTAGEEQLRSGFSKGHRADLRRAERDGVAVRVGTSADTEILHRMLLETAARKTFRVRSAAYYRRVMDAFQDGARLLVAELDGQPVGASLVIAFGRQGMYLAAGSNRAGLDHRAAHLLQWHAICWARRHGVRDWDLWGIADARGRHELAAARGTTGAAALAELEAQAEDDPLDGVYRFKKGWGGSVVRTLPAFDLVFDASAYHRWLWRRSAG
jgi:lipid II:glycine glycyltransferase (peptidoglycan interpeptide bridge formation enzyme)